MGNVTKIILNYLQVTLAILTTGLANIVAGLTGGNMPQIIQTWWQNAQQTLTDFGRRVAYGIFAAGTFYLLLWVFLFLSIYAHTDTITIIISGILMVMGLAIFVPANWLRDPNENNLGSLTLSWLVLAPAYIGMSAVGSASGVVIISLCVLIPVILFAAPGIWIIGALAGK